MASIAILISLCNLTTLDSHVIDQLGRTWAAIAMVESGGDPHCRPGDAGQAVGILQIRPIMLRDVNRIVGENRYSLDDRRNVRKSVEMFVIHSMHYWPNGGPEQWARAWNGGPQGPQREATAGYWQKVQRAMGQ